MSEKIIAIKKQIEDEATGAVSEYHVIKHFYVDRSVSYAEVGFATYFSEAAYKNGRRPVSTTGIILKINQVPPRGEDLDNWFYKIAAAQLEESESGSVLAGGELVMESE
ncbi:hypothetical protein PL75_03155 [Neisseria arctica]|uniref:Phage associated protein n=1 Tax=Neisseria arctica TaxID=1470200 RepID=A0A0J0YT07_9NEIS|nr:hypothetical protein [Neisseria arctica]KLT73242.1 hypothetical protein PL75_03155 [Neisseria arctica]UOO87508.1 hypothetical protein LVJ86_04485 [Neisseria arctica]